MTLALHNPDHQPNGREVDVVRPDRAVAEQANTVAKLAEWAQGAHAAHSIAVNLVETSFVPQQFRGKPHEATAAILSGAEMGMSPMASLRSFDVIQGTAAARAITLRAVVQSKGHAMWEEESTETRAIVCGHRKGESKVRRSVWTLDRARGLGLLGKDNWKKQPGAMLLARATAECARLVAADAILGIPYSAEEIADGIDAEAPVLTDTPAEEAPKRRTAKRKPLERMASAEPALPGADVESQPTPLDDSTAAAMVTKPQQARMFALWNDLGYAGDDNREVRLDVTARILGLSEPLESSNNLTADEADRVIEALEAKKAERDGGGS